MGASPDSDSDERDRAPEPGASGTGEDGGAELSSEAKRTLEELRLLRLLPAGAGILGAVAGAVIASTQQGPARMLFWVFFPAGVAWMICAWIAVLVASCPRCHRPFFSKWFVQRLASELVAVAAAVREVEHLEKKTG